MKRRLINSQISNMVTIESYRRRMCNMAENVLLIKNLPEFIDVGYVNRTLLKNGAIVNVKYSKSNTVNNKWLEYVNSNFAKVKIEEYLKK